MTRPRLPWRGPGGAARPAAAARQGAAAPRRQLAQAWRYLGAFCDELLLCAARVQVGPVGPDLLGDLGPRARRAPRAHPDDRCRGSPAARSGPSSPRASDTGRIDWAPREGGTLVRIEAAPKQDDAEQVRAFLRAGEGAWAEAVCPTGEGDGYVWTRKRAGRRSSATCGSASGGSAARRAGSRTSPAGITPTTRSGTGRPGSGETTRRPRGRPGTWSRASTTRRAGLRARDLGRRRRRASPAPATFDGLEAIELRRRPARVHRRGRAQQGGVAARARATATASRSGPSPARLPGGLELAEGLGVMEHHDANW